MSAISHETTQAAREPAVDMSADLGERWQALHESAQEVARQAGLARDLVFDEAAEEHAIFANVSDWQQKLALQALEDLDAVLQPGLAALRAIEARGRDGSAPAQALWREFLRSRESILALIGAPDEASGED